MMQTHGRAAVALMMMTINTLVMALPILLLGLVKAILPEKWRKYLRPILMQTAQGWVATNNLILTTISRPQLCIEGELPDAPRRSCLVVANHQSWADILLLQYLLHRRTPFLTFFLKRQLIWVPVLGLAWWALDFPFMRRYSRAYLKKYPHKAGKDLALTRRACEKFRNIPVAIMVFPEGTRFSKEKHQNTQSPYKHLLRPKAGGVGYVLTLLGQQIQHVVDISFAYPSRQTISFWNFLGGGLSPVKIRSKVHRIEPDIRCNYVEDPVCRSRVQTWINGIWHEKDEWLDVTFGTSVSNTHKP
ncbi:MAG: acyltransferase [Gammaproteobacteria bacterium]|nr:MAG: acyltransferase [Gammaproteobacteria bacterium]